MLFWKDQDVVYSYKTYITGNIACNFNVGKEAIRSLTLELLLQYFAFHRYRISNRFWHSKNDPSLVQAKAFVYIFTSVFSAVLCEKFGILYLRIVH